MVIAVISLLASILMPSLGRANEAARSMHCKSKLRDIHLVLGCYANDYNYWPKSIGNQYPQHWDGTISSRPWYELLTHMGQHSILDYGLPWPESYQCPSEKVGFGPSVLGLFQYTHYATNGRIVGVVNPSYTSYDGIRRSAVQRPGECILAADNNRILSPDIAYPCFISYRHLGKANVVYADSHVDSKEDGELVSSDLSVY